MSRQLLQGGSIVQRFSTSGFERPTAIRILTTWVRIPVRPHFLPYRPLYNHLFTFTCSQYLQVHLYAITVTWQVQRQPVCILLQRALLGETRPGGAREDRHVTASCISWFGLLFILHRRDLQLSQRDTLCLSHLDISSTFRSESLNRTRSPPTP